LIERIEGCCNQIFNSRSIEESREVGGGMNAVADLVLCRKGRQREFREKKGKEKRRR
jgi:hypothetical protein